MTIEEARHYVEQASSWSISSCMELKSILLEACRVLNRASIKRGNVTTFDQDKAYDVKQKIREGGYNR